MFYPSMSGGGVYNAMVSAEATAARNTAQEAQTKADLIAHDIDRLLLITEALWMQMKREHGYADDVLTNLIQEIESRKVIQGGMVVKDPPQACPDCGRMNMASRLACMYCGKALAGNPFAK